jgi:hypothetical protein
MQEIQELRALCLDGASLDVHTLIGACESLSKVDSRYKVSFVMFISARSPIELFNGWKQTDFSFNIKKYDDFYTVNLNRIIRRADIENGEREVSGSFGIFQHKDSNIWIGFTSDSPDFFEKGLLRFIESYKPDISRIYLSSEEMRSLFEKLEDNVSCEIFVKKAVLYSYGNEARIEYEKKPFQELFNIAENEDKYVDKVEYDIRRENKQVYHGFMSRSCIFYYYSGNIHYLFNSFIPLIAIRGESKSEVFEGRERHFGTIEIQPIDIVYPKDVFKNGQDNMRFIKAIGSVSRGAVSVYHKNPYVHVSFLDFIDGSNFDIFVTESNKISIIPSFKCSIHSLMRVCEEISKDFNEGTIELPGEPDFSLSDFIGG